jgi:hypothetical protein
MADLVFWPPLLACPAEIREKIYQLLLIIVDVDCPDFSVIIHDRRPKTPGSIYPAILRACRKINTEATATLYEKNLFTFDGSEEFLKFVTRVGDTNASLIRYVRLRTCMPLIKHEELEDALERASGLRRFDVHSHTMNCLGPAVSSITRFYQAMEPLLEKHPSLERVMSRWPRGYMYKTNLRSFVRVFQATVVTFTAEGSCNSADEKPFELGAAIAKMKAQLQEFEVECARRSENGESEEQLRKLWQDWEEKTARCISDGD